MVRVCGGPLRCRPNVVSPGRWAAVGLAALTLLLARPVAAQISPTLPSTREVILGPVSLYPQIALRDAGVDSNVYNDETAPKADLMFTVTPRVYLVLPIGGTRFLGTSTGDFVYYRRYADQRSATMSVEGRYDVTDAAFRPFVSAGSVHSAGRQGFEIDARVPVTQTNATAGADFDLTPITALTAWAGRSNTAYDRAVEYLSVSLADQLDHKTDVAAAGARFRFTPTTTVVVAAESRRHRFDHLRFRDADSLRVAPAVEFDWGGPLTGDARAGFMKFSPLDPLLAGYRGFIASARLHYTLLSVTRFDLEANRDVGFSFDHDQPYNLESGGRLTVAQRVFGRFELIAIAERRELRNQRFGGTSFDGRREITTSVGGGVGFEVPPQLRFTLTYEQTARTSSVPVGRDFERQRVLASLSYGL